MKLHFLLTWKKNCRFWSTSPSTFFVKTGSNDSVCWTPCKILIFGFWRKNNHKMVLNSFDFRFNLLLICLYIIFQQSICKKPKDLQIITEVSVFTFQISKKKISTTHNKGFFLWGLECLWHPTTNNYRSTRRYSNIFFAEKNTSDWCRLPQVSFNTGLTVLDVVSMNHVSFNTGITVLGCFQCEPQVSFNTGLTVLDVFSMDHRCRSIQV